MITRAEFPSLTESLSDEQGELRDFVNIYVNGEDVRFLEGSNTAKQPEDEIVIVRAVAGS